MSGRWARAWLIFCLALAVLAQPVPGRAAPKDPVVTDLGPASEVTSTSVAHQVGDHIWTATSGVSPVQVGAYNPSTESVEKKVALPTGAGSWAMANIGTDLYVGTYTPGDLYKIDTQTMTVTRVAGFGSFIWALTATPDGKIIAGTYPDAAVHEYDPADGSTHSYGTVAPGEQYVRSIAADENTIYAGIGSHAGLVTVDRATGATEDVLPQAYADRTFVATIDLVGDQLAVSLSPTGTLLIFDTDDLSEPTEVQPPGGDQYITAITIDDQTGDVYLGTRASGTLYRLPADSDRLERLGQPYDGAYFNRIFVDGDIIRGELTSQVVTYDRSSDTFTGVDLAQAGLPPAPELAMQVAATKDTVLVSGKAGIQVHDLKAGTSTRSFLPGEAKTMTPIDGRVYLGVYTLARLWSMRPDGSELGEITRAENEQTRPTDAWYDEKSGQLLLALEADYGKINGALARYDLSTGELTVDRGIVPNQSVRSVAVFDGIAYLGSETRNSLGTDPIEPEATVSAVDLRTGEVLWQLAPVPGAQQVTDLMPYRGKLYGTTERGDLFTLDPRSRQVIISSGLMNGTSTLVRARNGLYGTDGGMLFQVQPGATPMISTVVDDLDAEAYAAGLIAVSPNGGTIYTIKGRNLVAVTGF